jgi:poly-gamma-glutamate capsule biosynthesis protein CapA/YwtB (metallophosphatase superfamily)
MGDAERVTDPRVARRRARSRAVRRRRAAGLIVIAGVVVAGAAALASRGGGSGEAARGAAQGTATPQALTTPTTTADAARPATGSGRPVTLAFGGDVHFEPPIRQWLSSSPSTVLAGVAPALRAADIAMVNVETAITSRGTPAQKNFVFRAPAEAFGAIAAGGVDVVTMANNHGMDYGEQGLRDSIAAARGAGVPVVGIGLDETGAYAPRMFTVKGQRIAVIGATQVMDDNLIAAWTAGPGKPGLASAKREDRLVQAVQEARAKADTVVVYVHWGVELQECPSERQTSLAQRLTAAGADVVVGSHAHVLLGGGRMGGAFVDYGLGNFVFYANREPTVRSGVLEVTVTGRRVDRYRWVPARISGGLPATLSGSSRVAAIQSWNALRPCTGLTR